jgi:predicted small integral membrane protein
MNAIRTTSSAFGSETLRLLKATLVFAVGFWALLIAFGNVVDYDSNWQFVRHVLSMDTVFPQNHLKYRAITDPTLQTIGYCAIIATEWLMSALCFAGAWRLFRARSSRAAFIAAKPFAACGLVLVFLLYYIGFVAIGGEWFCTWQSEIWNGQPKAVMFLTCSMFVLTLLLLREEE